MALANKIAVVTGAALGIGKAITEILLKNGAKVRQKKKKESLKVFLPNDRR